MIVVKLQGGLGNQLFQYAIGRQLALQNGVALKFDTSWFGSDPNRHFKLDNFSMPATIATPAEMQQFVPTSFAKFMSWFRKGTYLQERGFAFNSSVLSAGPDTYLDGYWQSEKYFKEHEETIRKELVPRNAPSANYHVLRERMAHPASVSLHVRRGDYLAAKNKLVFEILDPAYYERALALIAERVSNPELFVFTDDPAWTKEHIQLPFPATFVSDGSLTDVEEVLLMSSCANHIIANSSFSWWGAWLDPRPSKIVVAPKKWFVDSTKDTRDLTPSSWILV